MRPKQSFARRELRQLSAVGQLQHGVVGALEPGIDEFVLFAETVAHVIEADAQGLGHLVHAHGFPRALLGEIDRRVDDAAREFAGFGDGHGASPGLATRFIIVQSENCPRGLPR